jgi:hypothetical protein
MCMYKQMKEVFYNVTVSVYSVMKLLLMMMFLKNKVVVM